MTVKPGPGGVVSIADLIFWLLGEEPLSEQMQDGVRFGPIDDPSGPRRAEARRTRSVRSMAPSRPKKRRKVSRYQRVFGKNLKALKKKHPRTPIGKLMSRAHRQTRRELK